MSEWNGIVTGLDYLEEFDPLEYDDHFEEIYQAQTDWCPEMRDEL